MVQIHPGVLEIWVPQSLAQVLPDLTSFWPMGKPIWGIWANNYDSAQLQVQTSPWNFKWGQSIQRFQRYVFRKVWTQFVPNLTSFWPMGKPIRGKWANDHDGAQHRPGQFHRTSNGENPSSGYRDMDSASLAAARPATRPPGPWRQYPSSSEGWGVKRDNWGQINDDISDSNSPLCFSPAKRKELLGKRWDDSLMLLRTREMCLICST